MDLRFQNGRSSFHSLAGWMKEDTMRVATLESPDLECPMTTPLFFTVGQSQPSVPHSLVRNNNPSKSWAPHSGASLLVKWSRVGQTTMASTERHPPSSGDPLSPTSVTHQRAKLEDYQRLRTRSGGNEQRDASGNNGWLGAELGSPRGMPTSLPSVG